METRIAIVGFGQRGKDIVNQCLKYSKETQIVVIADNNPQCMEYMNIPVVNTKDIVFYDYDEIWVCTVYYEEIRRQLVEELDIDGKLIYFEEPVMPILDERIRLKYLNDDSKYHEYPLEYIEEAKARMYCYPFFDEYLVKETEIHLDETCGMFYTFFNGKRMYLSRKFDTEQKARLYANQILMEQDARCPHCYWNSDRIVNASKNVVDVGTAEGIFGLKILDNIEHLYMFEADQDWIEALTHTYADYHDKVTIVDKYISDKNGARSISLDAYFDTIELAAIKMDIEGMEYAALQGAANILSRNNLAMAICVYHHADDNEKISKYLNELGYDCSNSKGWVICQGDWELENDETDFRRALLFANKS